MALYNPHPIPGFVTSTTDIPSVDRTYQGKVCPDPIRLVRYDYGLPAAQKLSALLFAAEGGAWTVTLSIQNDRVIIQNDDGTSFSIADTATARALGFQNFPVASVTVGSVERATATGDWVRGSFEGDPITVTVAGPTNFSTAPVGRLTHLLQWLTPTVGTDSAGDPISVDFRFGIDSNGHTFLTSKEGSPGSPNQSVFLGFSGNETPTTGSGTTWYTYVSAYPNNAVWVPSRPLARKTQSTDHDGGSVRLQSGQYVYNYRGSYSNYLLEAWADGPADVKDLNQHLLIGFGPMMHPGARLDYYPLWGDPRLPLRDNEVGASQFPYTLTHANYMNGDQGVVRCYVPSDMNRLTLGWPDDIRRRAPVSLNLHVAHDLTD
jgi:hypothetical protein